MLRDIAGQLPGLIEAGSVALEHGAPADVQKFCACFDRPSRRMPALAAR
jgi:hypothetical protein